jgi:regulator of replication initiation timing
MGKAALVFFTSVLVLVLVGTTTAQALVTTLDPEIDRAMFGNAVYAREANRGRRYPCAHAGKIVGYKTAVVDDREAALASLPMPKGSFSRLWQKNKAGLTQKQFLRVIAKHNPQLSSMDKVCAGYLVVVPVTSWRHLPVPPELDGLVARETPLYQKLREEALVKLAAENRALEAKLAAAGNQLQKERLERRAAIEKLQRLRQALAEARTTIISLTARVVANERKNAQLNVSVKSLASRLKERQTIIEHVSQQFKRSREMINSLRLEIANSAMVFKQYKKSAEQGFRELTARINTLAQKLEEEGKRKQQAKNAGGVKSILMLLGLATAGSVLAIPVYRHRQRLLRPWKKNGSVKSFSGATNATNQARIHLSEKECQEGGRITELCQQLRAAEEALVEKNKELRLTAEKVRAYSDLVFEFRPSGEIEEAYGNSTTLFFPRIRARLNNKLTDAVQVFCGKNISARAENIFNHLHKCQKCQSSQSHFVEETARTIDN